MEEQKITAADVGTLELEHPVTHPKTKFVEGQEVTHQGVPAKVLCVCENGTYLIIKQAALDVPEDELTAV